MFRIFVVSVFLFCCTGVYSEALTNVAMSSVQTEVGQTEYSFVEKLQKAVQTTQTCPHCNQQFSENRSLLMLLVGFLGQMLFASRFLIQWVASERRKKSYFPVIFWYLSIAASVLLLFYAVSIRAWPIILGQCFGVIVYGRNLKLIASSK